LLSDLFLRWVSQLIHILSDIQPCILIAVPVALFGATHASFPSVNSGNPVEQSQHISAEL
jgi:hypothetical protein